MGSNVVRLIRSDHRKIGLLLERAAGPHRNAEQLRDEIVAHVRAHVEATEQEFLPFVAQRLVPADELLDRHSQLLGELGEAAVDLDSVEEAETEVIRHLTAMLKTHVDAEEHDFLELMDESTDVLRLRRQGEMFRRRRDAEMKAVGGTSKSRRFDASRAELYERARRQRIEGRSKMTKAQLREALENTRDS